MTSINPFKGIIKTDKAPHNRTLRTSFGCKLQDAFFVFFGVPRKANFGVFDLFTLGIPLAIDQAWYWCLWNKNPLIRYPLGFLVGLINVPLLISRALIAVVCALNPVSLFVTWIVHCVSQDITGGEALKEEAFKLMLSNEENQEISLKDELNNPTYPDNDKTSWDRKSDSLENLRIQSFIKFRVEAGQTESQPVLVIKQAFFHSKSAFGCYEETRFGDKFCYLPIFNQQGQVIKGGENLKALKALIQLNVGNVTENLEKTPEGIKLLDNIIAAPAA